MLRESWKSENSRGTLMSSPHPLWLPSGTTLQNAGTAMSWFDADTQAQCHWFMWKYSYYGFAEASRVSTLSHTAVQEWLAWSPYRKPHWNPGRYNITCCIFNQKYDIHMSYIWNFLTNTHKRHPIAHPLWRGIGCLLWIQNLIHILPQFL